MFRLVSLLLWAVTSTYNPELCLSRPINCYDTAHPFTMASLLDARDFYDRALACPPEFPLGSVWYIDGSRGGLADGRYHCLDRGSMVTMSDGAATLDLLKREYVWRERLPVTVRWRLRLIGDRAYDRSKR